jgi:hypothetical protein
LVSNTSAAAGFNFLEVSRLLLIFCWLAGHF